MRCTGTRLQVGTILTVLGCVVVIGVTAQNGGSAELTRGFYGEPLQMYSSGPRRPRSILRDFAVDRMLKDKGFVRSIINCVLDKGPCESNGRKLRLMAPEILRGQCPGCSRTVHQQIRRVISHVQRNFPVEWSEVTRRFMSYSPGQDFGPPQPAFNPAQPPPVYNPGQQPPSFNPVQLQPPAYNPAQAPNSFSPPQPPPQYSNPADPNSYQDVYG